MAKTAVHQSFPQSVARMQRPAAAAYWGIFGFMRAEDVSDPHRILEMPVVRVLPVGGIGLDVIQAPKPCESAL
jgi:hypothetical protein